MNEGVCMTAFIRALFWAGKENVPEAGKVGRLALRGVVVSQCHTIQLKRDQSGLTSAATGSKTIQLWLATFDHEGCAGADGCVRLVDEVDAAIIGAPFTRRHLANHVAAFRAVVFHERVLGVEFRNVFGSLGAV